MPIYRASQLMQLRTVTPPDGKPDWANQIADVTVDRIPDDLCGPGLYALFLDGALFYIGLHVGEQAGADYSVLHRWVLHVVGQTMRSPRISFSRASLRRLLDTQAGDPVTEALAACLPDGRATDLAALPAHPLLSGAHCTAQKAVFAARHWDVFGPGHEDDMLDRITCLFQPVAAGWPERLAGAEGRERGAWAREQWLRPAETLLVNRFRPICNAAIALGTQRDLIGEAEVEAAMAAALPQELAAFQRAEFEQRNAEHAPAPAGVVEAYLDTSDAETLEIAEEEGLSLSELTFRNRLSPAGSQFINTLIDASPTGLKLYFTEIPDLRMCIKGQPTIAVRLTTAGERLRCYTRVDPEKCRKLGFEDVVVLANDPMSTSFYIDPAKIDPGILLVLVGASLK
ncbi:hypothetical protein QE363_003682 [Sphingomonas sp. SORGH_AS870]|uniref:hypothetical protein n=1 Tax=Sphingomonas sp. SORGH_AS_0870 TaxID=3041801 RepID=UPI002863C30B|nr:hypothetical protein [Sphingomonas sp. SORGH_AS_0870]MDR6147889.1 hypothetical protein [Sphingomonas sp. SORGH_AS_0870]